MKNLQFITFLGNDSDPFYLREIILIIIAFGVVPSFFFTGIATYTNSFILSNVAGIYFVGFFIYIMVLSANNARLLESGSLTFLLTMPLRKPTILFYRLLLPAAVSSILYNSVAVVFVYYSSFLFSPSLILAVYFVSFSMIFMYLSLGYLVSFISRNSIISFIALFMIFAIEFLYSNSIFPADHILKLFVLGDYGLSPSNIGMGTIFLAVTLEIVTGVAGLGGQYYVLRHLNLRSGR